MTEAVAESIRLRPALLEDARQLWKWRNEKSTRLASFNSQVIRYEEHLRWFEERSNDPQSRILIAGIASKVEVGCVRLDISDSGAEMNISIDRRFRGKGLGTAVIIAARDLAVKDLGLKRVWARVKEQNLSSRKAFLRAGFSVLKSEQAMDQRFFVLVFRSGNASPDPVDRGA